jgi:hypothetical protein
MASSRFGGFRTADGALSGTLKNHQQAANYVNGKTSGPQSPSSNQSFSISQSLRVENRRARPKIVKTSQDHGNMFFI